MSIKKKTLGSIYAVKVDNRNSFFQYIANDDYQLGGDVIRVFKTSYPIDHLPNLDEIINDEVEFHALCIINLGYKMGLWKKVGNIRVISKANLVFRCTDDFGRKLGAPPIQMSDKWYVWKLHEQSTTRIGKLTDEYKNAEIGMIFSPATIVERIKTGKYPYYSDIE